MHRSTIQTIAGSVLALTLGAIAGTWRHASPALSASASAAAAPVALVEEGRPIDPALITATREGKGSERWLMLLSASEQAEARDMPGLIRAARKDSAAIRMLAARWAELDPMHMFRSLHAEYLIREDAPEALPERYAMGEALFEHWTKADPAGVVRALTDIPNFSRREQLRMTVVNQLMKNDPEKGLEAMIEWNIRHYSPDMKTLAAFAAKDPERAARAVLKFDGDYVGRGALKEVARGWAGKDPEGGLRFAATLEPHQGATLARELMANWAQPDFEKVASLYASASSSALRNAIATGLVETLAKKDPAAALAWSNDNLQGSARAEAIGALIKVSAQKDVAAAAELAGSIEPGTAQLRACAEVFETWFNKGKKEREAAFAWLASLPDASARDAAFEKVRWNWAWSNPDEVRSFISGPHGHLASASMIGMVARSYAGKNPEAALEWANTLEGNRAVEARKAALEGWAALRPQAASEYARKLPAGPERQEAVFSISHRLIWQSPEEAGAWYRSLPSEDRAVVKQIYDQAGITSDQRKKLETAMAGK